ncbi:hypothetical protein ACJJTC_005433 [Scirpophaga incertulas]
MICAGCKGSLDDDNALKCNACVSYYCLECLNLGTGKKVYDLEPKLLSGLRCPSCTNVSHRKRETASGANLSPAVTKQSLILRNVPTIESISALLDQKLSPTSDIMINSRNMLLKDVKGLITTEISRMIETLKEEFTKTTDFIMEEVKDLKTIIAQKDAQIKSLQNEHSVLKNELKIIQNPLLVKSVDFLSALK